MSPLALDLFWNLENLFNSSSPIISFYYASPGVFSLATECFGVVEAEKVLGMLLLLPFLNVLSLPLISEACRLVFNQFEAADDIFVKFKDLPNDEIPFLLVFWKIELPD